jgi:N-acetylneuraminic acid mutarotase
MRRGPAASLAGRPRPWHRRAQGANITAGTLPARGYLNAVAQGKKRRTEMSLRNTLFLTLAALALASSAAAFPYPDVAYGDSLYDDCLYAIAQDPPTNGYVLAGYRAPASPLYYYQPNAIVFKTNSWGVPAVGKSWQLNQNTGFYNQSWAVDLCPTSDGNYAVTGQVLTAAGDQITRRKIYLAKLRGSDLQQIWFWVYPVPGNKNYDEFPSQVIQTRDRGFVIIGRTGAQGPNPKDNIILIRLDSLGRVAWSKVLWRYTHLGADVGNTIVELSGGRARYAIGGNIRASASQPDSCDGFVAFLDSSGVPLWTYRVPGQLGSEKVSRLVADGIDTVSFVGWTQSYGPGTPGPANTNIFFFRKAPPDVLPPRGLTIGFPSGMEAGYGLVKTTGGFAGYAISGFTTSAGSGIPLRNGLVVKLDDAGRSVLWARVHPSITNNNFDDAFFRMIPTAYASVFSGYGTIGYTKSFLSHPVGSRMSGELFTLDQSGNRPLGNCVIPVTPDTSSIYCVLDTLAYEVAHHTTAQMRFTQRDMPSKTVCWPSFPGTAAVGVAPPSIPLLPVIPPDTFWPRVRVGSYGLGAESVPVHYRLTGPTDAQWNDSGIAVVHHPDESEVDFSFSPISLTANGSYNIKYWVAISDSYPEDDTLAFDFTVAPPPTSNWLTRASVPGGPKNKNVKDGGALTYDAVTDLVYAFKGNNRNEFYAYNPVDNSWAERETIPLRGTSGKKKGVKKGAALAAIAGCIFAVKGNNSLEFWQYVPDPDNPAVGAWTQCADIPTGLKNVKEGAGLANAWKDDSTQGLYFLKGSGTQEFYEYDLVGNTWITKEPAPLGASNKPYKNGSCISSSDDPESRVIYALKGSYNEYAAYDVATNTWTTKTPLPLVGSLGKKKKVKDGAGLAFLNGTGYAQKGGNTREFWTYDVATDAWTQSEDMPVGGGKNVKGGGALASYVTYIPGASALYSLKGNNTLEFYQYTPASEGEGIKAKGEIQSSSLIPHPSSFSLSVAPNPFTGATEIAYSLPRPSNITLKLYDVSGRLAFTLAQGWMSPGRYTSHIDATKLARGIYMLRFEAEGYCATRKLIIE